MKKVLFSLLAGATAILSADIVKNPDADTLWKEDAQNVDKNWSFAYKNQHIRTSDGKTFSFECSTKGNTGHRDFIRVPVSKEYPWLVFRLNSVKVNPGYRSWNIRISALDKFNVGQTSVQETGYFACNVWEGATLKAEPKTAEIFVYNYTLKLTFSDFKMVKKPDNFIEVTSPAFAAKKQYNPGDKVRFTVTLKEPAEDVSIRLRYPDLLAAVKVNGMEKLQLKPIDDTQKVWSAEFEIKSIGPVRGKKEFRRNELLVRATILGGEISEPLWGTINWPYKLQ